jgi:hypothetical protein
MFSWLENNLLPCAYKSLFGIDCPACGMQRSLLSFLKGDLQESFFLYPPLLFVLIGILVGALYLIKPKFVKPVFLKKYFTFLLIIVLTNYVIHLAI